MPDDTNHENGKCMNFRMPSWNDKNIFFSTELLYLSMLQCYISLHTDGIFHVFSLQPHPSIKFQCGNKIIDNADVNAYIPALICIIARNEWLLGIISSIINF